MAKQQATEEVYERIFEHAGEGIIVAEVATRRFRLANPAAGRLLGYAPRELLSLGVADIHRLDDLPAVGALFDAQARGERGAEVVPCLRKDGRVVHALVTSTPLELDGVPCLAGFFADVTESHHLAVALQRSEALLRESQQIARVGGYEYDIPGASWTSTSALDELFGIDATYVRDVRGWLNLVHPADRDIMAAYLRDEVLGRRQAFDREYRVARCSDGAERLVYGRGLLHLDASGEPLRLVGTIQDITERRRSELAAAAAQRLESLGVLAGGIAHDFNNLLAGVFGYLEVAQAHSGSGPVSEGLAGAMLAYERAKALTQQLLTFAKGGEPQRHVSDMFPIIKDAARFALSGSPVTCTFDEPRGLWACAVDRGQVGQAIGNLVLNAQQAMPQGGVVHVGAVNRTFNAGEHPRIAAGRYVEVSVADDGVGIPATLLQRIFDPFYTTKELGTGLGLATTYSIVTRHGGIIDVASTVGTGTTFRLFLPAADKAQVVDAAQSPQAAAIATSHGAGRVLVVDDEPLIRDMAALMLKSLGYRATCVCDGSAAGTLLTAARADGDPFTLLILDLTIPGSPGGAQLLGALRERDPEVAAIASSGYSDDPVMSDPPRFGFVDKLPKPYTRAELAATLLRANNFSALARRTARPR
ncbi:MAG: PAS domain S-box protein [Myxococcota bacterium]